MLLISNMSSSPPFQTETSQPPDASIADLAAIVVTALIAASNIAPSDQCEPVFNRSIKKPSI